VAVNTKNNLSLLSAQQVPMLRLAVDSKQQQHLLYPAVFQEIFKFTVCILNNTEISEYPSMAMKCNSKWMNRLSVENL